MMTIILAFCIVAFSIDALACLHAPAFPSSFLLAVASASLFFPVAVVRIVTILGLCIIASMRIGCLWMPFMTGIGMVVFAPYALFYCHGTRGIPLGITLLLSLFYGYVALPYAEQVHTTFQACWGAAGGAVVFHALLLWCASGYACKRSVCA